METHRDVPPVTARSLAAELRALGVRDGHTIMVHTSLRALGFVIGGAQAVLDALREAVGADGTLVMPTQSWQLCDPAFLRDPDVAVTWWPLMREHLPAYDPARTPSMTMGAVAELFRTWPGTVWSAHPHRSIAANGPHAQAITERHDLDCPAGERSPLRVLYDLASQIVLLGVQADKATALHLAEHRASYPGKHTVRNGGPLRIDGVRQWRTWDEVWLEDHDFIEVASRFAEQHDGVRSGRTGSVVSHLLPMRELVDYAAEWFSTHRTDHPVG